ncbi:MAG: nucleotidyl transferase AbiEii/AbiGii toxin family protein [Actinobacteria bacterium]|nr:nucleotidyl transferase AbiEii/AbiGii toxin family protein [Actinomycetota bacterium]
MSAQTPIEIRRRLRARAAELALDFQQAVLYYAMERFLFRLSQTQWSDRLVVKGAVMLRVWDAAVARPTRDIDFLGRVDSTPEAIRGIVAECLAMHFDDGLVFESKIHAEPITVEDRYSVVRVKVAGDLGGARFVLRLDVGIDDAVVPDPGWVDYPALLQDEPPRILAYQPATAIAEKFQAMIEIGLANSRMKDYHDIWMLSRTLEFDGQDLADAIRATFQRRATKLPAETPAELTLEYTRQAETSRMWDTYRKGFSAAADELPEDLQDVADAIAAFLMPASIAAASTGAFVKTWTPNMGWAQGHQQSTTATPLGRR